MDTSPFALSLGDLAQLSRARTRLISPENPTGENGLGGVAKPFPPLPSRDYIEII